MPLKLLKNIWKSNQNGLGFYCVNIFKTQKLNPTLKYLLESNVLNDEQFGNVENKITSNSSEIYGPLILIKIEESDFKTLNFQELKYEIIEYWKDENWGTDLPIFKENFELALSDIAEFDFENREYYYINIEKIDSKKITEPNFFTYLICIISTLKNSDKIITMTFGLD